MKIVGNPGPNRITISFEEGEYKDKSVTMDGEPLINGVALYASTIKKWDNDESAIIDTKTKEKIVNLIKKELKKFPNSEIVE